MRLRIKLRRASNPYSVLRNAKSRKMSHQTQPSSKAIRERNFRKKERERKRFDGPLRQFVEIKYPAIFKEYFELYELMIVNHPGKRDLSRSRTFSQWKRAIQAPATDILSTVVREVFEQEHEGEGLVDQSEEATVGDQSEEENVESDEEGTGGDESDEEVSGVRNEGEVVVNEPSEGDEGVHEASNVRSQGEAVNDQSKGNEAANMI